MHHHGLVEFFGGRERGHDFVQGLDGLVVFVCRSRRLEFPEFADELVGIDFDLLAYKDELVARLLQAFFVHQELFLDLFAGAESRKLDFHILVGHLAVHADKVFGQRDNLDGLAHVEHEYLAAVGDTRRLEHEVHRLGDGHKVADNVGVRDGDGLALLYLALEQRDDATVAAEHVAKARGHEFGAAVLLLGEELHDHLAAALGRPHHVGGVYRLVGTDHHELAHVVVQRERRHVERADDVILDGLHGVCLHERHVLVRGGMEHHLGLVLLENLVHAEVVAHARDKRHQVQLAAIFHHEFLLDFVGVVLVDVDDYHLLGAVFCNLAHEFAAYASATASDHAHLALDKVADVPVVELDGRAAQKVFHLDVSNLAYKIRRTVANLRGIDKRADKRQHLHREPSLAAKVQDNLAVLGRAARDGKDNLLYALELGDFRDVARTARNQDSVKRLAYLVAVVVDKADGIDVDDGIGTAVFAMARAAPLDFLEHHGGSVAGTDNHGALEKSFAVACLYKRNERAPEQVAEKANPDDRYNAGGKREFPQGIAHHEIVDDPGDNKTKNL